MTHSERSSLHDAYAADYDRQVQAYGAYLPEALFGLCFEFIQPGQRLLDAGIGSGLSAVLFAKAGLQVHGFDFSPAMLEICRAKEIAAELRQHDLLQTPWPYREASYDHLVCCGVLHFIADLDAVFLETARVLREGGLFAFTTKAPPGAQAYPPSYHHQVNDGFEIYSHAQQYIAAGSAQVGFEQIKRMQCFVGSDLFDLWVLRKHDR